MCDKSLLNPVLSVTLCLWCTDCILLVFSKAWARTALAGRQTNFNLVCLVGLTLSPLTT